MTHEYDDIFGKAIYIYTRAQAIEDGELVDISKMAKESGFKIPVAVTRTVWDKYIEWADEDCARQTSQDQSGRLWDVLWMLYVACKKSKDESCIQYKLHVVPRDGHSRAPSLTGLKSVISGGDDGKPVITIMLPCED